LAVDLPVHSTLILRNPRGGFDHKHCRNGKVVLRLKMGKGFFPPACAIIGALRPSADQALASCKDANNRSCNQREVRVKAKWLQRTVLLLLVSLSLLLAAGLLFFDALLLPAMQGLLTAAYQGGAHPLVNLIFQRVATDAYKTPLWMYHDKLAYAFQASKVPALVLVIGATVFLWLSTRPSKSQLAIRKWPQRFAYFLFLCLLVALLVHVQLGTYSRFMGHDYCSASGTTTRALLGATIHSYQTWSGRFSADFLDSLSGVLGPHMTYLYPAVMLSAWFAVTALALSQFPLARGRLARISLSALLSAAVEFSTLQLAPDVNQSLYWGQSMRSVLPPLAFSAACVGMLGYRLAQEKPLRHGWAWSLAAGLLTFVAGGFSETYTAPQASAWSLLALAAIACDASRLRSKVLRQAIPFLLGSIAGLAVMAAAPGNAVRQAGLGPPAGLQATAEYAWASTSGFLTWAVGSWQRCLTLLALLLLSALVSGGYFETSVRLMEPTRLIRRALIMLPCATFVLVFSCFIPAAYAAGGRLAGRNMIIPVFVLVCAAAYEGAIIGQMAHARRPVSQEVKLRSLWAAIAVCVLIMYLLSTTQASYRQLQQLPTFAQYASVWDANDARILIAKAEGLDHVTIQYQRNWPGIAAIRPYSDHWINICASQYYGIEVTTTPE
jgi:succinate dehydrogenase hydrophobic anchor subunit